MMWILKFMILLSALAGAIVSSLSQNDSNTLRCSTANRHLFGKFLIQCWAKARMELGLSNPFDAPDFKTDENRLKYKLAVEKVVLKFYNYNTGTVIFYKKWQPIPYVRLYHCAETSIMETLFIISRNSKVKDSRALPKYSPVATQSAKTQSQLRLLIAANPHSSSNNSHEVVKSYPNVFTFVSDPLARFYAGYQDSIARLNARSEIPITPNITTIKEKIQILLENEQPLPATYQNLYPMSGAFFDFDIDILGRTETLKDDWNHKICPAYGLDCKNQQRNSKKTSVSSANKQEAMANHDLLPWQQPVDRHAVRPALDLLFSKEPKYLTAICYILLVDYVCLPMYALPKGCQHLNQTREAALLALSKGIEL